MVQFYSKFVAMSKSNSLHIKMIGGLWENSAEEIFGPSREEVTRGRRKLH
jgi:hypothetical protein